MDAAASAFEGMALGDSIRPRKRLRGRSSLKPAQHPSAPPSSPQSFTIHDDGMSPVWIDAIDAFPPTLTQMQQENIRLRSRLNGVEVEQASLRRRLEELERKVSENSTQAIAYKKRGRTKKAKKKVRDLGSVKIHIIAHPPGPGSSSQRAVTTTVAANIAKSWDTFQRTAFEQLNFEIRQSHGESYSFDGGKMILKDAKASGKNSGLTVNLDEANVARGPEIYHSWFDLNVLKGDTDVVEVEVWPGAMTNVAEQKTEDREEEQDAPMAVGESP